jgi:hypothetical protein
MDGWMDGWIELYRKKKSLTIVKFCGQRSKRVVDIGRAFLQNLRRETLRYNLHVRNFMATQQNNIT